MSKLFSRAAKWTARAAGHPAAFGFAVLIVVTWAVNALDARSGLRSGHKDTGRPEVNEPF
ncbi:MAG TPA: hypothetical protein VJK49_00125 [Candidatus Limnocylindrales bacterium]|nr:hypothetical protein [Candidatus Limnocylindrales bacterium]